MRHDRNVVYIVGMLAAKFRPWATLEIAFPPPSSVCDVADGGLAGKILSS